MAWIPGKFVWFEHFSSDPAGAAAFYEALLGWRSEAIDMGPGSPWRMIFNAADGIGGFRSAPSGVPNHWMSYLSVDDVDACCAAAVAAGATLLMAPTEFAAVGRGATIADPQGAVLSLWKGAHGDRPDVEPTPTGDWCWNELLTRDDLAALAFYEGLFGYTHSSKDMGAIGDYHLLQRDGRMRAGLMRAPQPDMPSCWLPYVLVGDVDDTAAKAAGLGAQLLVAPTEIPEIGWFAVIADPSGAALGVVRWRD